MQEKPAIFVPSHEWVFPRAPQAVLTFDASDGMPMPRGVASLECKQDQVQVETPQATYCFTPPGDLTRARLAVHPTLYVACLMGASVRWAQAFKNPWHVPKDPS